MASVMKSGEKESALASAFNAAGDDFYPWIAAVESAVPLGADSWIEIRVRRSLDVGWITVEGSEAVAGQKPRQRGARVAVQIGEAEEVVIAEAPQSGTRMVETLALAAIEIRVGDAQQKKAVAIE